MLIGKIGFSNWSDFLTVVIILEVGLDKKRLDIMVDSKKEACPLRFVGYAQHALTTWHSAITKETSHEEVYHVRWFRCP